MAKSRKAAKAGNTVDHPSHYSHDAIETITYIDQTIKYYPGNQAGSIFQVIKYVDRAPHKGNKLEDLRKAQWYLGHAIQLVEAESDGR